MRSPSRQSGFAMITAICLMSLTVIAAVALNSALIFEGRRSRMLNEDAQLRQLLLAGAEIAREDLASSALQQGISAVELPNQLQRRGARLMLESHRSPSDAVVEIEAFMPGRRMSQRIHLTKSNGQWRAISADLGG
jgi:type II secretory pathway component PulK